jgi:hypothetical protein
MNNKCFLLLITLIIIPYLGYAQDKIKDPTVIPLPGETGYGERSEMLWEGLCYDQHSNSMKVLSLTFTEIDYKLTKDNLLYLSTPVETSSVVKVRGTSINPGLSYQMDTLIRSGEKIHWKTSEVLYPENITANDLGVVGWIMESGRRIYVPVWLTETSADAETGDLQLVLRVNESLDQIIYRYVYTDSSDRHLITAEWNVMDEFIWEQLPIRISLANRPLKDLRYLHLEVKGLRSIYNEGDPKYTPSLFITLKIL